MSAASRVLLTRIGCRYRCSFCHPDRPYENPSYDRNRNLLGALREVDSAPSNCTAFVIGGIDCMEDVELVFEICKYIRTRRGNSPQIHIQSHCAEYQRMEIVERSIRFGINIIHVPLYGPTFEIHSKVMGPKPGIAIIGFPQLDAINNCLRSGQLRPTVHTVITKANEEYITQTIDILMAIAETHDAVIDYRIWPVMLTLSKNAVQYVPIKEMAPVLNGVHEHLIKANSVQIRLEYRFEGFPFCIFDRLEPRIYNDDFTRKLSTQYTQFVGSQLPSSELHYSAIDQRVPNYRI